MKSSNHKFLALFLITSVAFFSCKKEDLISPVRKINATTVNDGVNVNTPVQLIDWKIKSYEVDKTDKTEILKEYGFGFSDNGTLTATSGKNSITGTWFIPKENAENMVINFPTAPLTALSKEWHIVNRSSSELKLEYIDRNGSLEYVTFHKLQKIEGINPGPIGTAN